MTIERSTSSFTTLEQSQIKTINRLQEEVKLYQFDKTKDRQELYKLKQSLDRKKRNLINAIQELELMQKENNYERLKIIINVLKTIVRENNE